MSAPHGGNGGGGVGGGEREGEDFARRMADVEALVARLEASPDAQAREDARALARALLDLHGAALARVLAIAGEHGEVVAGCARDGLVASVLLLHGLHPVDLATRVREALAAFAATGAGRGVEVAACDVEGARVRVRVRAARSHPGGGGGGAVPAVVRARLAEALAEAAPDAEEVTVDAEGDLRAGFVPVERLSAAAGTAARASDRGGAR